MITTATTKPTNTKSIIKATPKHNNDNETSKKRPPPPSSSTKKQQPAKKTTDPPPFKRADGNPYSSTCSSSTVTSFTHDSSTTSTTTATSLQNNGPPNEKCPILSAKYRQKQAIQESITLSNRIQLLKKEEERAWKKIIAARARADEIITVREEQLRCAKRNEQIRLEEERNEYRVWKQRIQNERLRRQRRLLKGETIFRNKQHKVALVRNEKEEMRKDLEVQKRRSVEIIQKKHAKAKQQEVMSKQQKEKLFLQKQLLRKQAHDDRLAEEERKVVEEQKTVAKLEKIELRWIRKLKTTQTMQREAFRELEFTVQYDDDEGTMTDSSLWEGSSI